MSWSHEFWLVFFFVVGGLVLGFLLYYFVVFRMVPIRPHSDRDARDKIEAQEILNKQIQAKRDQELDDSSPRPDRSLAEKDKAKVKAAVEKQLEKLLQPEYAIAQNCITQKTYEDLKSTADGYSATALGLIFSLALLVYALRVETYVGRGLANGIGWCLFFATAALFIIALGSRDMFFDSVRNLILVGIEVKYDASLKSTKAASDAVIKSAKDKAKSKAAGDSLQKAIQAELKNATFSVKGLKVDLVADPSEDPTS